MNDLQNADEQVEGTICGFCEGEGEHIIHFALDSAENIYETCPICKGKGARTVNDLQNALEQLKCRASGGWEPLHLLPKEAQALLDERDVLREACEALQTNGIAVIVNRLRWDDVGYNDLSDYLATVAQQAHAALAKTRNEEV